MRIKFHTVYEEYKDSVYGYLLYMTKDIQLAEDLSQETFLKIFLNLGRFKGKSSIKTWVLKIARNTFLTYARKKNPVLLEEQEIIKAAHETSEILEDTIIQKIQIQEILMSLNELDRTIILLRDYEELSYEEIASILDISAGALKSRLYRARQKFKKLYQ